MSDLIAIGDDERDRIRGEVANALGSSGSALARFLLSAIGGTLPFVGGAVGAASGAWGEREQTRINELLNAWLKLQEQELHEIGVTLLEVIMRIDSLDEEVRTRVESPEYVALVRRALRSWPAAESEDKRRLIRNLLANAAACKLTSDDVLKLFIDWIGKFSETHFKVIKILYQHPRSTRLEIWRELHGERVREDSAEADLFKLIMHEWSMGHVIRQERETDDAGRFLRASTSRPQRGTRSPYLKTAFDDDKAYVLTELGTQFVHYTMNEIVPRIGGGSVSPPNA